MMNHINTCHTVKHAIGGKLCAHQPTMGRLMVLTIYCGTKVSANKNALSWISHYSGSTSSCRRSASLSEICSNYICRLRVVIRVHASNLRAVVFITTK